MQFVSVLCAPSLHTACFCALFAMASEQHPYIDHFLFLKVYGEGIKPGTEQERNRNRNGTPQRLAIFHVFVIF